MLLPGFSEQPLLNGREHLMHILQRRIKPFRVSIDNDWDVAVLVRDVGPDLVNYVDCVL